jgi:hypothetical protein
MGRILIPRWVSPFFHRSNEYEADLYRTVEKGRWHLFEFETGSERLVLLLIPVLRISFQHGLDDGRILYAKTRF